MSKNPLLFKFLLILAVIVGSAVFTFPPRERINLGLDLRGGAHILMEVDVEDAVKYQMDQTVSRLGQALKEAGLTFESILPTESSTLELRGTDPARRDDVQRILGAQVAEWQVTPLAAGSWRAEMSPDMRRYLATTAVDTTLSILRKRVDALGVSEPLVQRQGLEGNRILIQLPGVEDPERVKVMLQNRAILEWKALSYPPDVVDTGNWFPPDSREALVSQFGGRTPDDTELYPERSTDPSGKTVTLWWPLKRVSTVIGSDLRNAWRTSDRWGEAAVSFELSQDAGRRFEVATRENLGRRMAIVLGTAEQKEVISAPVIQGVIRDQGIISGGGFSVASAEDLALSLRSGAIPTDVRVIEERTVGPSLGRDSIRAGLIAGVAGFGGVLLFMVVYYRMAGLNAMIALALNVLFTFGALGALPWLFSGTGGMKATLTLPGIAGLILTIGIAVDTNVLIFERIREELRLGKTVRSAVEQGFGRAFMTILDCHVTTVVAAICLAIYGTGPVQGFAVTLIIGIASSMFTGVFVSRQLFELVLSRRNRIESLSI